MERYSRMTLSRRMLIAAAVALLGLAVLAIVSLWGIGALRQGFDRAADEFADLRVIAAVEVRLARARGVLSTAEPDAGAMAAVLREALAQMQRLEHSPADDDPAALPHRADDLIDPGAHARERELVADALVSLTAAANRVEDWPADTLDRDDPILTHHIDRTLEATGQLAALADRAMAAAGRYTSRQLEETIVSMMMVIGLVVVSALLVAAWQYYGIVRPLWRLRRGVRQITAGQLDKRLIIAGDRDFAELATDFNRMADQLEAVLGDLAGKVEAKSRELVRSERLASVGHLAAGIAHEINNPLGIIAGHAELSLKHLQKLTDDTAAGETAMTMETLQIIRDEAFRCKEIIQQLLSLSRKSPVSRQRVDLARIAEGVVKMVRGHDEARGRSIELDFTPHRTLWVDANPQELKQVLLNLVVNALQATEPGNGYVDVIGYFDDTTGHVVLTVEDNGRGMDPDTADHVFEPFFSQHKGADSFGLGLSVTHAIVDAHGGRISAWSAGPGRGARFTVRFPPADPPPDHAPPV